MQEQLPVALGLVVLDPGLVVRVDVRADEPGFALAHVRVGLLEAHLALPERLHLASGQHDPGLEALEQVVVVPGFAVLRDWLLACHTSIVGLACGRYLPPFPE